MNKSLTFSLAVAALCGAAPLAAEPLEASLQVRVRDLALAASQTQAGARVEVDVGQLDPRLKLAPCQEVQPYLPPNARLWGAARIGLRCLSGPVKWNVFLPITVKVFAPALVAAHPLSAGTEVGPNDLVLAEVDLAAGQGQAVTDLDAALGRTLARSIAPGAAVRSADLRARQWFAAGEMVKVVAVGPGYAVSGEGRALNPGIEGQAVRVRTESGRIVTGQAVGERRVELLL